MHNSYTTSAAGSIQRGLDAVGEGLRSIGREIELITMVRILESDGPGVHFSEEEKLQIKNKLLKRLIGA